MPTSSLTDFCSVLFFVFLQVKVEEPQIKNEKVLHYVQRKEYFAESDTKDSHKEYVLKPEPTKNIVPVERPVVEFGGAVGKSALSIFFVEKAI